MRIDVKRKTRKARRAARTIKINRFFGQICLWRSEIIKTNAEWKQRRVFIMKKRRVAICWAKKRKRFVFLVEEWNLFSIWCGSSFCSLFRLVDWCRTRGIRCSITTLRTKRKTKRRKEFVDGFFLGQSSSEFSSFIFPNRKRISMTKVFCRVPTRISLKPNVFRVRKRISTMKVVCRDPKRIWPKPNVCRNRFLPKFDRQNVRRSRWTNATRRSTLNRKAAGRWEKRRKSSSSFSFRKFVSSIFCLSEIEETNRIWRNFENRRASMVWPKKKVNRARSIRWKFIGRWEKTLSNVR